VNTDDTIAASVSAPQVGFVAAVSVGDRDLLLASKLDQISVDLDSQLAACAECDGEDLETSATQYEVAVNQIRDWFEHDLASASAGVGGSQSGGRKRLINRIDETVESAPPHERASRSGIAARARRVATSQHGAAIEAELDSLARSPLPDHEWLELVAGLESARLARERDTHRAELRIHALLLLRQLR
jgi:hypothetical protein